MSRYVWESVVLVVRRSGKCPNCGKRRQRSKRFEQTVNPWNKNPDGTVRTRAEVVEAVRAEAAAWKPDFTCFTCCDRSV